MSVCPVNEMLQPFLDVLSNKEYFDGFDSFCETESSVTTD